MSNTIKEQKNITYDEDCEAVNLCKKGNIEAFEPLVRKHQKRLFNTAFRMTGNYEEASEIVQDAFLSAFKGIRKFEGKSLFSTWLHSIVVNSAKNRLRELRKQHYHEQFSLDDPVHTDDGTLFPELSSNDPSVADTIEKRELQNRVQECINALDNEFREVIVLRDIQGFAYSEISDMLRIAEGTVKSRLFRARESMKICLQNLLGEL